MCFHSEVWHAYVVEAFKILTSDDKVKAIVALKVPVVVRLEGTNVDQGKRIPKESGMTLITAEDLDDAAEKAVKALKSA
ncbi:putative succinate--CoA ligase (ADP-forming) [Helianthus annuus]|nr:putative succinate--CoA ligase (ADP-forming) [Helianthus annuus]